VFSKENIKKYKIINIIKFNGHIIVYTHTQKKIKFLFQSQVVYHILVGFDDLFCLSQMLHCHENQSTKNIYYKTI